jgi:hypothetical protein
MTPLTSWYIPRFAGMTQALAKRKSQVQHFSPERPRFSVDLQCPRTMSAETSNVSQALPGELDPAHCSGTSDLFEKSKFGDQRRIRERTYRRACSVRFVFRECEFECRGAAAFAEGLFLWQEVAHQRFSYCGRSHIFVHRLAPASCSQWQ